MSGVLPARNSTWPREPPSDLQVIQGIRLCAGWHCE